MADMCKSDRDHHLKTGQSHLPMAVIKTTTLACKSGSLLIELPGQFFLRFVSLHHSELIVPQIYQVLSQSYKKCQRNVLLKLERIIFANKPT